MPNKNFEGRREKREGKKCIGHKHLLYTGAYATYATNFCFLFYFLFN
jgi:hypothetical protein